MTIGAAPSARRIAVPAGALSDLGAALLLLLLTVVFYWRILTPNALNRGSFPKGDFVEQFYAFAYFRTQEILAGRLPTWNPYAFGGQPFIADIQSAFYYPLHWVTTLVAGPRGYPFEALEYEAVFHIFLAGFFMYLLASRVSGSRPAGLLGGMVYGFGGYLSAYPSQQLSVLEVQTWLPLVLLFVHLATNAEPFDLRRSLLYSIVGGLTLGVAILGGHPQASLYTVYGVVAYFAFRILAQTGLAGWRQALRRAGLIALLVAVGFGVAAAQLVPTVEFMGISSRAQIPFEMSAWAFPLRDILQIILPGTVSYYSPMYVGILPLALAIGAVAWTRTRETWFWTGLATAGLLVSFGGNTIIHSVLYNAIPGAGTFRHQERGIVLFSAAMAVLAAIGARALFAADRTRLAKLAGLWLRVVVAAAAVLILLFVYGLAAEDPSRVQNIAAFLVLVCALVGLLLLFRLRGLPSGAFVGLALAIVAFDLMSVSFSTNFEKTQPGDQYRATEIQKYLQRNDANGRTHNDWQYPLNYGDVFRIRDVNGASPLVVERYRQLFNAEPRERVWQLLNVKYYVTWQGGLPNAEKVSVEKTGDKEVNLYALPDPLPRVYVVHAATVIPDDARSLRTVLSPQFDPGTTAVLDREPSIAPSGRPARSAATVRDLAPDRLVVETRLTEPGILVLSEVNYPGWRATVNGQSVEILRAQHALRGVALPAGGHQIEFIFDSGAVKLGQIISLLTVVASLFGLGALALVRRR
ncbi:MAG: YfhO family protein [Dehalococcoidia bacterium]